MRFAYCAPRVAVRTAVSKTRAEVGGNMPQSSRRCIIAALALMALHPPTPAAAQSYPTRPITIIVPLAAGTGMDTVVRLYGDELSKSLGQSVVVDNRPGAATMIGTDAVAKAAPDGYTLLVATSSAMAINPVR
jgi:tripartite-type tricarboxylate transporter receptor subunit TctC